MLQPSLAVPSRSLPQPDERPATYGPGCFEPQAHYYPRVLNAQIHPLVSTFFALGNERLAARFAHLHPETSQEEVLALFRAEPRHFRWGGADLLHVTTAHGVRRVVVIETNSCPSGQKSMPRVDETEEQAGYRALLQGVFLPMLERRTTPVGELAVLYDKNHMEASGYAAALADLTDEPVHLVPFYADDPDPPARFDAQGLLWVRIDREWRPIRAALRYVTQRPWTRIPPVTRTVLLNPVLVCLAGGRNKLLAAKAYDVLNGELQPTGLRLWTPETYWGVAKAEVPLWVRRLGGFAVVKDPYSNAGQGVYTVTCPAELEVFMEASHRYDRFIVQALIGNSSWTSRGAAGRYFHVGTVPDRHGHIHVADLRFMVGAGASGFFPVALYARRARAPLRAQLDGTPRSWDMLGTNLSVREANGAWATQTERLLLMDGRDFAHLGLGLDDFVEAYVQTVLAITAIDRMAGSLLTRKGRFRRRFFESMNPDPRLVAEIRP